MSRSANKGIEVVRFVKTYTAEADKPCLLRSSPLEANPHVLAPEIGGRLEVIGVEGAHRWARYAGRFVDSLRLQK